jgi:hypothetical protein
LARKYGQNTNISETLPLIGRTVINITLSRTINLMGRGQTMEFSKASTRNTWESVAHSTEQVRNGSLDPALSAWVKAQGFALDETVFSCVCRFDDGIYTGTLVDRHGRAWEFFADLNDPQSCDLEDVTDTLGPKSPDHPQADLCDKVTMALLYQREQQVAA